MRYSNVPGSTSTRARRRKESGDVIAAGRIFAEVGEVVSGAKPGRQSDEG